MQSVAAAGGRWMMAGLKHWAGYLGGAAGLRVRFEMRIGRFETRDTLVTGFLVFTPGALAEFSESC